MDLVHTDAEDKEARARKERRDRRTGERHGRIGRQSSLSSWLASITCAHLRFGRYTLPYRLGRVVSKHLAHLLSRFLKFQLHMCFAFFPL